MADGITSKLVRRHPLLPGEDSPVTGRIADEEPAIRLGCYRGIAGLGALTLAAEVASWRRFRAARTFMSCTGLVPAGYSSGERTRRGHITKAGSEPVRTALTEAAAPGATSLSERYLR